MCKASSWGCGLSKCFPLSIGIYKHLLSASCVWVIGQSSRQANKEPTPSTNALSPSPLYVYVILSLLNVLEVHTIIIPILQVGKLRHKEVKQCFEVTQININDLVLVLRMLSVYKIEGV